MRRIAMPAVAALLFLAAVPSVSANPQRDTWDSSYHLSDTEFCGFAVDVHDYGSDNYFQVSDDGWTWAKTWEGTRVYTNPANLMTASMVWNWMTTQKVASRTDTTLVLLISSHGSVRVISPTGRVVALNAGEETLERDLVGSAGGWTQVGDDILLSWKGPHPMDFGNAFCDAIRPLLNP